MRHNFIFALSLLVVSCAAYSFSELVSIKLIGDNKLVLHDSESDKTASLQVDFRVDGYTVNCNKSLIVIWGREINKDSYQAPSGYYTAYNLNSLKRIGQKHSAGVYEVIFIDSARAYISTQSGEILDARSGKVSLPKQSDNDFINENDTEECAQPILRYNRYSQY